MESDETTVVLETILTLQNAVLRLVKSGKLTGVMSSVGDIDLFKQRAHKRFNTVENRAIRTTEERACESVTAGVCN